MSAHAVLLAMLLELCTVWVRRDGTPVLAPRIRARGGERYLSAISTKVDGAATIAGVPARLLASLTHAESGLIPAATSVTGAVGFLQLQPGTPHHTDWRRSCVARPESCEAANLVHGARYLRWCWRVCGDDWSAAVSRYRGAGCVPRKKDVAVVAVALKWGPL